jgi:hypothetical protein
MGDLEDYVGEKVVNGHCDCMFLINTFQWPWTQIAALVAPRPMLFENSGHDTIFPMNGNDRIRSRLERLYGFYTKKTDQLFDIGVMPGGHDDKVELRLMAYRWINRHLKNDDEPVTEPELPPIEEKLLRAFPDELPADELNTKIDESFVPLANNPIPATMEEFENWRTRTRAELRRIVFRGLPEKQTADAHLRLDDTKESSGSISSEPGITIPWKFFPGQNAGNQARWLVVLGEDDSLEAKPAWLTKAIGDAPALLVAPRGTGPLKWADPAPYYIQRSLALLGRTVDGGKLFDVLAVARQAASSGSAKWNIIGRGRAGVIGAYAALFEPRLAEITAIEPPLTHRDGPIFLNVLRVLDIPDAFALLAPRPVTIFTAQRSAFDQTGKIDRISGGNCKFVDSP